MWWADGGAYLVSSYARAETPGQIWFYDPKRRTPPYGGLILAEDGDGTRHLFGATGSGRPPTAGPAAATELPY